MKPKWNLSLSYKNYSSQHQQIQVVTMSEETSLKDESFLAFFYEMYSWISSTLLHIVMLGIVFGGIFPYIPQYLEIKKTDNADGFSLYVCFVLLVANVLRLLFWFGHWFELPLVLQSILMIITMMVMISLCVRVRNRGQIIHKKEHLFTDFDFEYFWKWTDMQSYIEFMLTFTVMASLLLYIFFNSYYFIEGLGFLSTCIEAMLGVPQFITNYKSKSTQGMSLMMVIMWTTGDTVKTIYYSIKELPFQFFICGCLQVCIDLSIIVQYLIYRNKTKKSLLH